MFILRILYDLHSIGFSRQRYQKSLAYALNAYFKIRESRKHNERNNQADNLV